MQNSRLLALATLPETIVGLDLDIGNAVVSIRREDRADIVLEANYPDTWSIDGGSIRQTRVQVQDPGNIMIHGNVSVGGLLSRAGSISIGGSVRNSTISSTVLSSRGRCVSIVGGEVWVDGKKVTDSEPSGAESKSCDPDRLEIKVPHSYRGSININNAGNGKVEIDCWQGGDFTLGMSGCGDLKVGRLDGLNYVSLRSSGTGDIDIESVCARNFHALLTGTGDLDVEELNVDVLSLQQSGTGDATIDNGSAQSGSVSSFGTGDTKIRGRFKNISQRSTGLGEIKIRVRD